ncbi:hypothetical protein [Leptospira paudalimensis]|uniref:Lipoprotein n=1 Tax=Leptospira paudalimensis TaxID=2950024 RepID=A0ABT3M549_9LEPT|nr:hypothetical protein [Leptospira paudalimensis]MCW7503511.1 hypothetical protein [Leptospira paudalimensis]
MNQLNIFIFFTCIILIQCVPNNQSARDRCKEGTQNKSGKEADLNFICSIATINYKRAEQNNETALKDGALFSCFLAIEDLKDCDKKANIKFGISN